MGRRVGEEGWGGSTPEEGLAFLDKIFFTQIKSVFPGPYTYGKSAQLKPDFWLTNQGPSLCKSLEYFKWLGILLGLPLII